MPPCQRSCVRAASVWQKRGRCGFGCGYATQAPGAPSLQVFNRDTKRLQRERAAADVELSRRVDYLRDEVAKRLCERLLVRSHLALSFVLSGLFFFFFFFFVASPTGARCAVIDDRFVPSTPCEDDAFDPDNDPRTSTVVFRVSSTWARTHATSLARCRCRTPIQIPRDPRHRPSRRGCLV